MAQETLTRRIVRMHLDAMAVARYEVGLRRADGRLLPLVLTPETLLERLPWLAQENRRGADVFIRPQGSTGLVLVDDLDASALTRMSADDLTPAVVIETSPGNHQAWVRIAGAPIAPELATAAARVLAERYDGDPRSATWRHYGRLAGFENRKAIHRREDGGYPLAQVRAVTKGIAPGGEALLVVAQRQHKAAPILRPAMPDLERVTVTSPSRPISALGELYRQEAERLIRHFPRVDVSRLDWMITLRLARAFVDVGPAELAQAMVEGSPHLIERKAGHVGDYVARTVSKALAHVAAERPANKRE